MILNYNKLISHPVCDGFCVIIDFTIRLGVDLGYKFKIYKYEV